MKNIIIISLVLCCSFVYADLKELQELQAILQQDRASWVAAENSFSVLPVEAQQKMMGLLPGVSNPNALPKTQVVAPVSNVRYENPLKDTGIRDQQQCGSCYAHGALAAYEGWKLNAGQVGSDYNLSEQWFMMKAKEIDTQGYGGCNGWYLVDSMNLLKNYGVVLEEKCPYQGYEAACPSLTPSGKISYTYPGGTTQAFIKGGIDKGRPVYVGFAVYSDFSYYTSGYYEYKSGYLRGYHAVCVVGYDATGFKVKNSWGPGWGVNGYFFIKYSQMTNSVQFGTCFEGSFYITD
jgi:C1A family cysteine protease